MQEYTATLRTSNTVRVTTYLVEIKRPDGSLVKAIDTNDLTGVRRELMTVFLRDKRGSVTTLDCASLDDAGRITEILRQTVPMMNGATAQPSASSGGGSSVWRWIGVAVVLMIVLGVFFGDGDDNTTSASRPRSNSSTSSSSSSSNPLNNSDNVTAALREQASGTIEYMDGRISRVTLLDLRDDAQTDSSLFAADDGMKYWVAEVEVAAVGSKSVDTGSWKMRTTDGYEYDDTYAIGFDNLLGFTEAMPGGKVRGLVVFEIPSEARPRWVRYDPNQFMAGDLYFGTP